MIGVVLSGYDHPVFNKLTDNGWQKVEFDYVLPSVGRIRISKHRGAGNVEREHKIKECIWLNRVAVERNEVQKAF